MRERRQLQRSKYSGEAASSPEDPQRALLTDRPGPAMLAPGTDEERLPHELPEIQGHHLAEIAVQSPDAPPPPLHGPVSIQAALAPVTAPPLLPLQRQGDLGTQIA